MSIIGCPGWLAGDVTRPSDVCGESGRGVGGGYLIGARQERRRELRKVVCVFTHLLPLYVSVSHPLDMVSHFPTWSFFRLSLCRSFCLAVILALAICFAARHTRRQEGGG